MLFKLHVAGPGLDVSRMVAEGQPPLVLGRDADADICLPDPERTVSRRHLSVWVEGTDLHFHVLSVVNGVDLPGAEVPPGARGVLPPGENLLVGDYALTAQPVEEAEGDPWAVLDTESGSRTIDATYIVPTPPEDDPFSADWGFESTFGPTASGGLEAATLSPTDVRAFYRGLGMDVSVLTEGEVEAIGRMVRVLVMGVLQLHAEVTGVKEDIGSGERTMLAPRESNPLKGGWSAEAKLHYLFGGRIGAAGLPPPERAVRELVADLVAHNGASASAARIAMVSVLREFAPPALRERLLGEGPKLFEGTRAWDAYCKYYEEHGADLDAWAQRLLEKYFTGAYLRESMRIRRETSGR